MPQQKKRKSAEEILGIKPQRKSAEEILGIAPRPQPAPTPAPPVQESGFFENLQAGAAGVLNDYIVDPALNIYSAGKAALSGDFAPAAEMAESAARGSLGVTASVLTGGAAAPLFTRIQETQAPRLQELQARQEARQAQDPTFEPVRTVRAQLAREAAANPSLSNKAARFVGGAAVGAAPAVATGILTGGSVPAIAGITALQSAGQPQTAALNTALAAVPVPPILRRIRGGRGATAAGEKAPIQAGQIRSTGAVAEQASVRAEQGVARLEAPTPSQTLPSRPNLADDGPPLLEEAELRPFDVREGKPRPKQPGAAGPRIDEYGFIEGGKGNNLAVAKEEQTPILETISAFIKAGMLTGPRTHLKNVAGTGAFQISEELARIPGSIVDAVVSLRTGRRTLTGPNAAGLARSFREAATEGIDEAKKAIRTGQTKFDLEGLQEINSKSPLVNKYVNGVFRVLKAEDVVFRTYATRRALEERAKALALTEMRQGKIVRGQVGQRAKELVDNPPADLQFNALADGEFAVFSNDNFLSRKIVSPIRQSLKSGDYPKLGPATEFMVDRIFPFIKTPTNVIARMLEYSGITSGPKALALSRKLLRNTMTEAEQRAFAQSIGRGSIGVGLVTLGWKLYNAGKATGFIEDDPSRRTRDAAAGRTPGSIKIGNQWLQLTGAAPLGSLIALGATLARETEQEQLGMGIQPALETIGQAVGEQPLLIGSKQVGEAITKPGSVGEKLLGGILGSTVPTAVSDVAEAFDPQQREATGITGRAQSRIPGARNLLPPAQDVLGQPRQDFGPGQAFLDPTRATTDVASENPLFAELVRLDVGVSGFEKKKDETDEQRRTKTQAFGALYIPYGQQLVASRQYQLATPDIQRGAIKYLNSRAKSLVEEGRQAYAAGPLNPSALIFAATDAARREANKKNAGKR